MNRNANIIVGLFPTQKNNCLYVGRSGEEVKGTELLYLIPVLLEDGAISRAGCGVAGYVDDARRCHIVGDDGDHLFIESLSRRIEHHDVGTHSLCPEVCRRL